MRLRYAGLQKSGEGQKDACIVTLALGAILSLHTSGRSKHLSNEEVYAPMPKPTPRLNFKLFGILNSQAEGAFAIVALVVLVLAAIGFASQAAAVRVGVIGDWVEELARWQDSRSGSKSC